MKKYGLLSLLLISSFQFFSCNNKSQKTRILVFAKTAGYYHESIPAGFAAIQKLGEENNFDVDTTRDASLFTEKTLKKYNAVVFLNTTGNLLNADQKVAFQRYIQAGGGFAGIHAAADAEYKWPWYNKLVGAYFMSHPGNPNVREAAIDVKDTAHASMKNIPMRWTRTDEWYNYKSINPAIKVLATLDEDSYEGGENGNRHPIAWYHDYDGGRAFYTGGGHTTESFSEPLFLQHLAGGIKYAIGDSVKLDYSKAYAVKAPEENRFTKVILSDDLNEPMELAVAPDKSVYFVERSGGLYRYDPVSNSTKLMYHFPVLADTKEGFGNGMLGMTIDPDFDKNNFLYFFYTPDKSPARQNISRFTVIGKDSLDLGSEKIIIEVPIELEVSAHTGGSLAWDKNKNLFISTGDNTVPFASDGYAPIDEIPGRITYDAQRSAGNTNDLRGKILRIHPEADGSYTIPEGNLFPKGMEGTRPEIYTMGCRNPYRISVDAATSILYWGEVGPDAGNDGKQGPRGYDEFNQAKKAGNYGWPYFVGDNKAYHAYDFATKEIGQLFNEQAPENHSPYNTGLKTLPPATKAMIWYPYGTSDEFPDLGNGGRCAVAGPVYHFNKNNHHKNGIPEYYDNALFVFDWMRNWIFAVRLDENQNYKRMEAFMPMTGSFKRPIDMEITSDGVMYLLEYGSVYGADNDDARLVRIEFNGGNRAPVAQITVNDSIGLAPLKVNFNSSKSYDFDEDDQLKYEWNFGDGSTSKEPNPEHTYSNKGVYKASLKVTDPSGETDTHVMEIKVGNTVPLVNILSNGNSSFYFTGNPLSYEVNVSDQEEKNIDAGKINVSLQYVPKQMGSFSKAGHQQPGITIGAGKSLMDASDCKACHQLDEKSVGPTFMEIAKRYNGKPGAVSMLADKIIKGGAGVWGDHAMSAHPQLSKEQTTRIVEYILSLESQKLYQNLPSKGSMNLTDHLSKTSDGNYVLSASYTDDGNGVVPLTGNKMLVLRSPKIKGGEADVVRNIQRQQSRLGSIHNKSYFVLKNIDLKNVSAITYRYSSLNIDAALEIHVGSAKGPLISTLSYKATGDWNKFLEATTAVKDPGGVNDLYFVFKKDSEPNQHIFTLDWLEFKK